MRARTTSALTALAGAIVAAVVFGAPTTAQAAPEAAYPAPAPAVRVSSGSVTSGGAVRLSGRSFLPGEPIVIRVQYRITPRSGGYDNPFGVQVNGDRRADADGKFGARVRLGQPGYAVIKVTGKRSHQSVTVHVRVLAWRNPWPDDIFAGTPLGSGPSGDRSGGRAAHDRGPLSDGWSPFRLSSNESDLIVASATSAAPVRSERHAFGADTVPALLGLTALLGSAFVARRRRQV